LRVYRGAFHCDPPKEFLDVYETLAEALYWGAGRQEELASVRSRGKGYETGYSFADIRLLPLKIRVDRSLAACAKALLRTTFRSEAEGGQAVDLLGRGHVDRSREEGSGP
jgi:hypothetical protein